MVGIIMETAGLRFPFYVKVHRYTYEKRGAWTGVLSAKASGRSLVSDHLVTVGAADPNSAVLPRGVHVGPVHGGRGDGERSQRYAHQAGFTEFINNALSLNPDMRAWWGTVTQALKQDGLSVNTFGRCCAPRSTSSAPTRSSTPARWRSEQCAWRPARR